MTPWGCDYCSWFSGHTMVVIMTPWGCDYCPMILWSYNGGDYDTMGVWLLPMILWSYNGGDYDTMGAWLLPHDSLVIQWSYNGGDYDTMGAWLLPHDSLDIQWWWLWHHESVTTAPWFSGHTMVIPWWWLWHHGVWLLPMIIWLYNGGDYETMGITTATWFYGILFYNKQLYFMKGNCWYHIWSYKNLLNVCVVLFLLHIWCSIDRTLETFNFGETFRSLIRTI